MNRVELISKGQKLLDIKDLQVLQKEYEQWIDDLRQSEDFGKTMNVIAFCYIFQAIHMVCQKLN